MSYQLTKKDIVKEIIKCGKDPVYFINNFVKISHPVQGLISFKLYPFQEDCISDFLEYKYNIVVKSRQLGLSTITSAYCLWLAMFHEDKDIRLMATRLDTAKNMIQKIGIAFKDVPAWIKTSLGITKTEKDSSYIGSLFESSGETHHNSSEILGPWCTRQAHLLIIELKVLLPNI
ncbi:hypothetical protein EBS02_13010, partial [bacterium]|nr:hypothetical protein [bacterium]